MTGYEVRANATALLGTLPSITSWEEADRLRTLAALHRAADGLLSAELLRAAVGDERASRSRPAGLKGVSVLQLSGPLFPRENFLTQLGIGTNVVHFRNAVRAAAADATVRSLLVMVDSGGGYVDQIPETAAALREARAKKPVIMSIVGTAASAAYWLAAQGSRIESTASANIGGVGVFGERISVARKLERAGIDVHVIGAGQFKTEGHPATLMSDAERAALQQRVNETYEVFLSDVAQGRHVATGTVRATYGGGRAMSAASAQAAGMIDVIRTTEATLEGVSAPAAANARLRQAWAHVTLAPLRAEHAHRRIAAMREQIDARMRL